MKSNVVLALFCLKVLSVNLGTNFVPGLWAPPNCFQIALQLLGDFTINCLCFTNYFEVCEGIFSPHWYIYA